MIKRHPESSMLVEYASGSLELAPTISITTHLQFCETCRAQVNSLNSIGGEMLSESDAQTVSDDLLNRVLDCLEDKPAPAPVKTSKHVDPVAQDLPRYIQGLLPAKELSWRSLSSSVRMSPIPVGESRNELSLLRIKAGGKTPEHGHKGRELTVVLKGSFSDEDGVYQEGDFLVREPGDIHRPQASMQTECICLSVLEAPIKLTGVKQVLNPFLPFSPA